MTAQVSREKNSKTNLCHWWCRDFKPLHFWVWVLSHESPDCASEFRSWGQLQQPFSRGRRCMVYRSRNQRTHRGHLHSSSLRRACLLAHSAATRQPALNRGAQSEVTMRFLISTQPKSPNTQLQDSHGTTLFI